MCQLLHYVYYYLLPNIQQVYENNNIKIMLFTYITRNQTYIFCIRCFFDKIRNYFEPNLSIVPHTTNQTNFNDILHFCLSSNLTNVQKGRTNTSIKIEVKQITQTLLQYVNFSKILIGVD